MADKRVDRILVDQGKVRSRTEAQKLIAQSLVEINLAGSWQSVQKPSEKYDDDVCLRVTFSEEQRYVSRAGLKLEAALESLPENLQGWVALDIGQSTGGFTDCLLAKGVRHVVGLEVGHGQLVETLRSDSRVTVLENYNARYLQLQDLPDIAAGGVDLVVMDVSFISQHLILPRLPSVLTDGGWLASLVKPQFELDRRAIGKNGIVKDVSNYALVEQRLSNALESFNFSIKAYCPSPIVGGDGNQEFLVVAQYNKL